MSNFKEGDKVNYHALAGRGVTSTGHEIYAIEREPNPYGCGVARITKKAGVVALENLSLIDGND